MLGCSLNTHSSIIIILTIIICVFNLIVKMVFFIDSQELAETPLVEGRISGIVVLICLGLPALALIVRSIGPKAYIGEYGGKLFVNKIEHIFFQEV